jgi:hypothetical protein
VVYSPTVTGAYSVIATHTLGCSMTKTLTMNVVSCVGVNEIESADSGLEIYPNPNHGSLYVAFENLPGGTTIQVYNITGALIKDVKVTSAKMLVDLQSEANGVYMLKVIKDDKVIRSSKILKQ